MKRKKKQLSDIKANTQWGQNRFSTLIEQSSHTHTHTIWEQIGGTEQVVMGVMGSKAFFCYRRFSLIRIQIIQHLFWFKFCTVTVASFTHWFLRRAKTKIHEGFRKGRGNCTWEEWRFTGGLRKMCFRGSLHVSSEKYPKKKWSKTHAKWKFQ